MCIYIIYRLANNTHIIIAIISEVIDILQKNSLKKVSFPIMFKFSSSDNDMLTEKKHVGIRDKMPFDNFGGV